MNEKFKITPRRAKLKIAIVSALATAVLTVIIVLSSLFLLDSGKKGNGAQLSYDLDVKINEHLLVFDNNSVDSTATLTGFNLSGMNNAQIQTEFSKTLAIPKINKSGYKVTGIDLPGVTAVTATANSYLLAVRQITAVVIPDSVTSITTGSFFGFGDLIYFETPFLGTTKDSGAPLASMFSLANEVEQYMGTATNSVSVDVAWYDQVADEHNKSVRYQIPYNLQEVKVSGQTTIGNHAFMDIKSVKSIRFPMNLIGQFGLYAFAGCTNLQTVDLPYGAALNIGLFSICSSLTEIKLPGNISSVPNAIFEGCQSLTTVLIPATVKIIEEGAFSNCTNLANISVFTDNWDTIDPSKQAIDLPNGLERIETYAFQNCKLIEEIVVPSKVTYIGAAAFGGCSELRSLTLPFVGSKRGNSGTKEACFGYIFSESGADGSGTGTNVMYTAKQQFGTQEEEVATFLIPSALKTVVITAEGTIAMGAFQNLTQIEIISINKEVTSIALGAAANCVSLKELTVPFIGTSASSGGHMGVIFGNVPYTGTASSSGYEVPISLKTIRIINQPTIYSGTFNNCGNIETVEIGEATTYMRESVFYGNNNLTNLIVPFVGCSRGEFYEKYWWWRDKAWRNTLQWIFSSSYHDHTYPNNSLRYEERYYIKHIPTSLKSVTVTDESVIGTYSFRNFSSLTEIRITNKPSSIESLALHGCSGLVSLTVPYIGRNANPSGAAGGEHVLGYIFGASGYSGSYAVSQYGTWYIPSSLTSVTIGSDSSRIFNYAFANCKNLESVLTEGNIISLGAYAFANCYNLQSVDMKNASYSTISSYAFYNCRKISSIDAVSPASTVTSIGSYAFAGSAVLSVDFKRYETIGSYAFANCLQLTSVDITSNVASLGEGVFADCQYIASATTTNGLVSPYLFKNCISLTDFDLRNITTTIPEGMFYGCRSLKYDTGDGKGLIQDPQTSEIGAYAFYDCQSFDRFIIAATTEKIGAYAFAYCTGLEYMTIPRNTTKIDGNAWLDVDEDFFFYVYFLEEDWPTGWVTNWNCDRQVFTIGYVDESVFTYEYVSAYKGYRITGTKPGITLVGDINLPLTHNGLKIASVGEKALANQKGITSVILSSRIIEVQENAFNTGKRVDVYTEQTKASNKNWTVAADESNWIYSGFVFYKDDWNYGTGTASKTPYVNLSSLTFALSRTYNRVYTGSAIEVPVDSVTQTSAICVNVEPSFPTNIFSYTYTNNISVGTATVTAVLNGPMYRQYNADLLASGQNIINFANSTKFTYQIEQAPINIYLKFGDITSITTSFTKTYDGSAWSNSSWGGAIAPDLDLYGLSMTGRLQTSSADAGHYSWLMTDNQGFVWSTPYKITRAGIDVTRNYVLWVYLDVDITPKDVTLDLVGGEWDATHEYYLYPYNGSIISAKGAAFGTDKILDAGCVVDVQQDLVPGIYPHDNVVYDVVASLNNASKRNYNLVDHEGKSINSVPFSYKIVKGKIIITIDDRNYLIGEDDDYWSFNEWNNTSDNPNLITGLGAGSTFIGTLQSTGHEATNYYFGNPDSNHQINWGMVSGPTENWGTDEYHIYRTDEDGNLIDERNYYDVIVSAYVQIVYNEFDVDYYIDSTKMSPTVITHTDAREYLYIKYATEGNVHTLYARPQNVSDLSPVTLTYLYDDGVTTSLVPFSFTEINKYVVGVQISRKNYKTYEKRVMLDVVKSDILFGDLSKEYDRVAIDPDTRVLKKDPTQGITYTYYKQSDITYSSPLDTAPYEVGHYVVLAEAPATTYFNALHQYITFEISRRKIIIDVTGSKPFDDTPQTFTITDDMLSSAGYLLSGDHFTGSLHTISATAGIYSSETPSMFTWSPNWGVYNLDSGVNETKNYQIVLTGDFEIKALEMVVHSSGRTVAYDGNLHSIDITVETPSAGYQIYYSQSPIPTNTKDFSKYSVFNYTFFAPDTYTVYFAVTAPNYNTYYDSETVTIEPLNIKYTEPTLTVDYDGYYHRFEITIESPWNALVEYSDNNGVTWSTRVPEFKEPDSYIIRYRITADNYNPVLDKEMVIKITEENLKEFDQGLVTVSGFEGFYDGVGHSVSVTIPNMPVGSEWAHVFYSEPTSGPWSDTNPVYVAAGSYEVQIQIIIHGYKRYYTSATVNIKKLPFNNITIHDYSGVFDGQFHSVTLSGLENYADLNYVLYYTSNQDVVTADSGWMTYCEYKNVGVYTVWVKLCAENYEDSILQATVTITVLENPTGDIPFQTIQYAAAPIKGLEINTVHDGVRNYYYYSAFYNVGGEMKPDYAERIGAPQELGLYYVRVQFLPSSNCHGMELVGFFEIVPRVLTVEYEKEVEYNGLKQAPDPYVVTGTVDTINIISTLQGTEDPIEIGTYQFEVRMFESNPNYVLNTNLIEFKITPRHIKIELQEEHPYDRNPWRKVDGWEALGVVLLEDHKFVATMETDSYIRTTYYYVYPTPEAPFANVVRVTWDIQDSKGNSVKDLYDVELSVIVKIVYPELDLNFEDTFVTYDGNPHSANLQIGSHVTGSTIFYSVNPENSASWITTPISYIEAGEYEIFYRVQSTNYEDATGSVKLIIEPADLDIEVDAFDETYDTCQHYATYTVRNVNNVKSLPDIKYYPASNYTLSQLQNLYKDLDKNNTIYKNGLSAMVDAGDYYCAVFFDETANWHDSFGIQLITLKQKDVRITFNTPFFYRAEYNKQKVSVPLTNAVLNTADLFSSHFVSSPLRDSTVQTNSANAKTYDPATDFEFGHIFISDEFSNNVAKNYHPVLSSNVTVIIDKTALTLFKAYDLERPYDGGLAAPEIETDSDGILSYTFYKYDQNGNLSTVSSVEERDVGKYYVVCSIGEGTNYYAWTGQPPTADVTITPREVGVIWSNTTQEFNGELLSAQAKFIDVFGIEVDLDVSYFDNEGNSVEGFYSANSYEAYASLKPTYANSKNYTLTNNVTTFIVTPVVFDINVGKVSHYNTQTPWSKHFDQNDIEDFFPGLVIRDKNNSSRAVLSTLSNQPGEYKGNEAFTLDYSVWNELGVDVTSSIQFNVVGVVNVFKQEITVIEYDKVVTYAKGITYRFLDNCLTVSFPQDYQVLIRVNGAGTYVAATTHPGFSDVGKYTIEYQVNALTYETVSGVVEFEIVQKEAELTFRTNLDKVYDGKEVSPSSLVFDSQFNGTAADLQFKFYPANPDKTQAGDALDNPPIDVGDYIVEVTSRKDYVEGYILNYTPLYATQFFTISQKELKLEIKQDVEVSSVSDLNQPWTSDKITVSNHTDLESYGTLTYQFSTDAIQRGLYEFKQTVYSTTGEIGLPGNLFDFSWDIKANRGTMETDISYNYYLTVSFSMNVHYPYIEAIIGNVNTPYTGGSHHATLEVTKPNMAQVSTYFGTDINSMTLGNITDYAYTNPGTYIVYYELVADNFETKKGQYSITIDYLERDSVEVDTDSLSKVYDGTPAGKYDGSANQYLPDFTPKLPASTSLPDHYPTSDVKITYQRIGSPFILNEAIDAGEYSYILTIPKSTFYKETVVTGTFRIAQATITVRNGELDGAETFHTAVYTGNSITYDFSKGAGLYQFSVDSMSALPAGLKVEGTIVTKSSGVGTYTSKNNSVLWQDNKSYVTVNGVDATANYLVALDDVKIGISEGTITFDEKPQTVPYDGRSHTVSVHMIRPLNYTSLEYFNEALQTYTTEPVTYTQVGTHPIKIKIITNNYKTEYRELTLEITMADSTIEIEDLTKTYNALEVLNPTVTTNNNETPVERYEINYYMWNGTQYAYMGDGIRPINTGKYQVDVVIPSSNNFNGVAGMKEFEIKGKEVSLQWSNSSFVYNGAPQAPQAYFPTADDEHVPITYSYQPSRPGGDVNHTAQGVYLATASIGTNNNYILNKDTITCPFSISPRAVTITLNQKRTYSNSTFTFTFNTSDGFSVYNIVDTHRVSSLLTSKHSSVAIYKSINDFEWNSADGTCVILDAHGTDVSSNYKVNYNLQLEINYSSIQLNVTPYVGEYDGYNHGIKVEVLNAGDTYQITYATPPTGIYTTTNPMYSEVGTYVVYYKVTMDGHSEVSGSTTVQILRKNADLKLENPYQILDKIYDGNPISSPKVTYVDHLSNPRNITYTYYRISGGIETKTSDVSAAGDYHLVITLADATNYDSGTLDIYFTIFKREITITQTATSTEYSATRWTKDITSASATNLANNQTFVGTIQTISANVGSYKEASDFEWHDGYRIMLGNNDVTANYEVNYDLNVTITEAKIEYEASDYFGEYDAKSHTISVLVSKPIAGAVIEYTTDPFNEPYSTNFVYRTYVGTTVVYFRISAPNYKTVLSDKTIVITGIPIDVPDPDNPILDPNTNFDNHYTYCGNPYPTPSYTTVSSGVQTVTYYLASDLDTSLSGAPINAGQYVFVIHIASDGEYAAVDIKQSFNIYAKEETVTWENTVVRYTGADQISKAYYTDISGNRQDCKVESPEANVGKYTVTATTTDTNYKITNPTGDFEILKAQIVEIIIDPNLEFIFGESIVVKDVAGNIYILDNEGNVTEIQDGTGSVINPAPELGYKIIIDDNMDAGEHTFTVQLNDPTRYEWTTKGDSNDIEVAYTILPLAFPNPDFALSYEYQYQWLYTSEAIKPDVVINVMDSSGNLVATLVFSSDMTLTDYSIQYNKNIEVTTDGNLAEIKLTGENNYRFSTTLYFQILPEVPETVQIKEGANIQFIEATYSEETGVQTVEDGSVERTQPYQPNTYIGHLHQETLLSSVLEQIANKSTQVKVFDAEGNEISKADFGAVYIGTGFAICLYNDDGDEIDKVTAILFGDLNGDGSITALDYSTISKVLSGSESFATLNIYYFAGITSRDNAFVTAFALAAIAKIMAGSPDADFNSGFLNAT